jgi:mediator of RNA polymerase II transcription subunit 22
MKLLLLLSDEAQIAHRRDSELKTVHAETDEARENVAALLDELLRRHSPSAGSDSAMTMDVDNVVT